MPSWLTILCALLAVHLFALEVLAERARRTGETTLYRAPLGLRILFGIGIIGMVYGAPVTPPDIWIGTIEISCSDEKTLFY